MSGTEFADIADPTYRRARDAFSTEQAAAKYPNAYGRPRRHRREQRAILRALRHIPRNASVLDLPCGTGRATRLLLEHGFRVVGADASPPMVRAAEENFRRLKESGAFATANDVVFDVRDVMDTGFADDQFDAVFCNRLLHHFAESSTRRRALAELRRISRGPVIVSFFNTFAVDAAIHQLRAWLRPRRHRDIESRSSVLMKTFAADAAAAGLRIEATIPAFRGVSRQWFLVLRRDPARTILKRVESSRSNVAASFADAKAAENAI